MEKIRAAMIIEILGKPKDYVKESLVQLVEKLGTEKGVKVTNKTIHEPTEVKDSKELFTTFAEVEVEFDAIENYFGILFAYMPAHIEIIQPEKILLTNIHLNEIGNILMQRLHNYDSVVKKILTEREIMMQQLRKIQPPQQQISQIVPEKPSKKKQSKKSSKKKR
jgi:hypothetical protein